jgi:hypothetical protein
MDITGVKEPKLPREQACKLCLVGKIHESFYKTIDNRATEPLVRIHVDILGIKTKTTRGYKYFLLLIDDYTCTTRYTS